METYAERLAWAIKNYGLTQTGLASLAGVSPQTVQYLCDKKNNAQGSKHSSSFAEALGISPTWLETGKGDKLTRVHASSVSLCNQTNIKSTPVRIFDAIGSMGGGELQPENDTVTASVWLSDKWIEKHISSNISSKKNLAIITGYGDSMSPTFNDGDILLVDTEIKLISADGIYVLSANNKIYIKRVRQRFDGQYEISSDNPAIRTIDILNGDHEISIHGRVVWAWNGRKL